MLSLGSWSCMCSMSTVLRQWCGSRNSNNSDVFFFKAFLTALSSLYLLKEDQINSNINYICKPLKTTPRPLSSRVASCTSCSTSVFHPHHFLSSLPAVQPFICLSHPGSPSPSLHTPLPPPTTTTTNTKPLLSVAPRYEMLTPWLVAPGTGIACPPACLPACLACRVGPVHRVARPRGCLCVFVCVRVCGCVGVCWVTAWGLDVCEWLRVTAALALGALRQISSSCFRHTKLDLPAAVCQQVMQPQRTHTRKHTHVDPRHLWPHLRTWNQSAIPSSFSICVFFHCVLYWLQLNTLILLPEVYFFN